MNSADSAALRRIRHVALDLDGTVYRGQTLFPFTVPFLKTLDGLGIGHTFLTNNSSKSVGDYLVHLRSLGIAATPEQLYTSTQAALNCLRTQYPQVHRLFVLGTSSMQTELTQAGFAVSADNPSDEPDAVLV